MRHTTCCARHQLSNSDHHHPHHPHHHHHHNQCHHSFPSSASVPLFLSSSSSSTRMGMASTGTGGGGSGGGVSGGGSGLTSNSHNCSHHHHHNHHHPTAFNGTATLPASYSSNGGDHFCSFPSASSASSPFCSCECSNLFCCQLYAKPWLPFSRRAIALFALSLVFILIWSSVVSFVLLSDSAKEQQRIRQTAELFELHRDLGQLAFEMGDEMIYTLNTTMDAVNQLDVALKIANFTLSTLNTSSIATTTAASLVDKTLTDDNTSATTTSTFDNSSTTVPTLPSSSFSLGNHPLAKITSRWNKTDALLRQVGQSLATRGYLDFESDVTDQLEKLRSKCVHQVAAVWPSLSQTPSSQTPSSQTSSVDPLTRIVKGNQSRELSRLWPLLSECVRTFEQSFTLLDSLIMKEHFAFSSSSSSSSSSLKGERSQQQHQQSVQYSKMAITDLLIRNMPYTLFVRGIVHRFTSLSFGLILVRSNFTQPFNVSEYFHYYFSSRQLIESSFVWNHRFLAKYQELESTDYQADMLLAFFDTRRTLEHEYYLKMSAIFGRLFSLETLKRVRSYIKKKNVESVERLLVVNGSATPKFIADQEANLMNIQLNTDLVELMGVESIEQVVYGHEQMSSPSDKLQPKYDRLLRNQIGFMSRVQDFLNISLSGHLSAGTLSGEQSLHYYTVLCTILLLSVFFTLTLFACSGCCYRSPHPSGTTSGPSSSFFSSSCCCCPPSSFSATPLTGRTSLATAIITFSRRFRRRLWNIGYSPFSLFKLCFGNGPPFFSSSNSGSASGPNGFATTSGPPRYPLLYKSTYLQPQSPSSSSLMSTATRGQRFTSFSSTSCGPSSHHSCHHPHHYHHHHHQHHPHPHSHHNSAVSNHYHQMITINRRTTAAAAAAAVVNRSNLQTTTSRELSSKSSAAKTVAEKSRHSDRPSTSAAAAAAAAEAVSLIDRESKSTAPAAAAEPACMCCIDSGCSTEQQQKQQLSLSSSFASSSLENATNSVEISKREVELQATTSDDFCSKCSSSTTDGKSSSDCLCKPLMVMRTAEENNKASPKLAFSKNNGKEMKNSSLKQKTPFTLLSKTP